MMSASDFLKQYGEAVRIANRLKNEYLKEADLINSIRSPQGSDGQPHGSGVSSPSEQKAVRLAELYEKAHDAEIQAGVIKYDVIRVINQVHGDPAQVLHERYIGLKTWSQIAETLNFSERQCYNLRNEGLEIVDQILEKHFSEFQYRPVL